MTSLSTGFVLLSFEVKVTVAFICGPWYTPLQVQGVDQFAKMVVDVLEFVVVVDISLKWSIFHQIIPERR